MPLRNSLMLLPIMRVSFGICEGPKMISTTARIINSSVVPIFMISFASLSPDAAASCRTTQQPASNVRLSYHFCSRFTICAADI